LRKVRALVDDKTQAIAATLGGCDTNSLSLSKLFQDNSSAFEFKPEYVVDY